MRQGFKSQHWSDAAGNPAGGVTYGVGFAISWQNGPLGRCNCAPKVEGNAELEHAVASGIYHLPGCERQAPNGAFVEDVIAAAIDRLEFYQGSKFKSHFNTNALIHLRHALNELDERTKVREAAGVEGTHELAPA